MIAFNYSMQLQFPTVILFLGITLGLQEHNTLIKLCNVI